MQNWFSALKEAVEKKSIPEGTNRCLQTINYRIRPFHGTFKTFPGIMY